MELRSKSSVYQIQKILSKKEESIVYVAYRKSLKYSIAQKVLLKLFQKNSTIYPLELRSILQVHSPYCVSVLHFETVENKPAFILEWIDGINLFQLLRQSPPLDPFEISYICWNIQKGLVDLKKHNLCHGDLNWSNVLIDRKGHIRLVDFGKGNYTEQELFSTPLITAPELLHGKCPDFFSDLFSLGVLEKYLEDNIEDTSQWGSMLSIEGDPLLDPCPNNRRMKDFIHPASARKTLAKKVARIRNQESLWKIKPSTDKIRQNKYVSFLLLCFSLFMMGFIGNEWSHSDSSIHIRSHRWLHIELAGKSGFTPFDSGLLKSGMYLLKWKDQNQKGIVTIHLNKNSHLLLTEKDLK